MLISYNWLQNYFEEKLPSPEKIAEGIIFHSFEVESVINQSHISDYIFDIKILPDRAHDCLSHWGIAKEISVIFNLPIKKVEISEKENLPTSDLKIEIKNDKCRSYIGQVVKNIKVGPSPDWLREKLEAIGQRSINNIVDATNYVMFDLGNPIHAFDLDKLESHKIIVESAVDGEKMILLDGKEVELDSSVLTIRDGKDALAIAGIKGGKKAEIDENAKNIVIEVANFDPISTHKTCKKINIFTDSAKRFENEISPELVDLAIEKISDLIIEVAGGERFEKLDIYEKEEKDKIVKFDILYINKLLGLNLSRGDINEILNRFGYSYANENDEYELHVPYLRLDINSREDIAEEIGRIYGYDKIVPQLPKIDSKEKDDLIWQKINISKIKLINDGYREVITYTFTNKGEIEVLASASDKKFLRTNLTDGLKESIRLNKINLPLLDVDEVRIFEIGTVFLENGSASAKGYGETKEEIRVAYGDEKNITEMTLDKFVAENNLIASPDAKKNEGEMSYEMPWERDGASTRNFSAEKYPCISKDVSPEAKIFKPWSIYPFITRDIAIWVPSEVESSKVYQIIKENAGELLVREPKLFDEFKKEDKTSYAFRLVFQSYEKTLTDNEINVIMARIEKKILSLDWTVR
jgi:phenylalanyl-tRNA synthetase beta chain